MNILYFIIWILLIGYTFLLAPGIGVREFDLVKDTLLFNGVNPWISTLFYMFGIWPFVFGGLLFKRETSNILAWPFVIGIFFFGVFALLPYYFLNESENSQKKTPRSIKAITESKLIYVVLIVITVWLLLYGVVYGDIGGMIDLFTYNWFVHIMIIDTISLILLSIITMYKIDPVNYKLGFIPVIGPLLYILKQID